MSKIVFRFLKKQKLLLGILWLMLRGNDARCQEVELKSTCYRYQPRNAFLISADISAAKMYPTSSFSNGSFSFQLGYNHKKSTLGVETELFRQDNESLVGLYLRYFPYDKKSSPITIMIESKYLMPFGAYCSNDAFSISSGIILSNRSLGGIEIYESLTTDLSTANGFVFYTGFRFHLYFAMKGK